MKKVLFLMFAAASFTFASCDSPKENATENAAEQVREDGEAQADKMEASSDSVADKMEDSADKMDGGGAGNMDAGDTKMDEAGGKAEKAAEDATH